MNDTVVAKRKGSGLAGNPDVPALRSEFGFAVLLTVVFLFLGCLIILRHEVWRDECQAWMITRDSASLPNLFYNLRYDGHPPLWYLLLYPISRFAKQPCAMQLAHILLAAAAVYVFARFAPFGRLQRAIFAFGYFPFYEYAVISRNYAIGIVLLFIFCVLYPRRSRNLLSLSGVLFLLANASTYGWMISIALGLTLFVAWLADKRSGNQWAVPRWKTALSIGIIAVGIAISTLIMMPEPDSGLYVEWYLKPDLVRAMNSLAAVGIGHFLIPDIFTQWRIGADVQGFAPIQAVLGLALIMYSLFLFARRPVVLFAYAAATAMMLGFMYAKHPGAPRHHGHLFIVFVVCLWLSACYKERELASPFANKLTALCVRYSPVLLMVLLCVHLLGGIAASGRDIWLPFSRGRDVARFIEANGMSDIPILGERDAPASPVAAYLNRPIYYPANGRSGTYIVFDRERKRELTNEQLIEAIDKFISQERRDVLLVLNRKPSPVVLSAFDVQSLGTFSGAIVIDETYWLFLVKCRVDEGREDGKRATGRCDRRPSACNAQCPNPLVSHPSLI